MAINKSDKSKTITDILNDSASDSWTIDNMTEFGNYMGVAILPIKFILDDYYSYFSQFLINYEIDEKYYYSPAAFAEKYYGTPALDFLVLYFANIPTIFEFTKPVIKVLPLNKLKEINQLIVAYKNNTNGTKDNPFKYEELSDTTDSYNAYKKE